MESGSSETKVCGTGDAQTATKPISRRRRQLRKIGGYNLYLNPYRRQGYKCRICGKRFSLQSDKEAHENTHLPEMSSESRSIWCPLENVCRQGWPTCRTVTSSRHLNQQYDVRNVETCISCVLKDSHRKYLCFNMTEFGDRVGVFHVLNGVKEQPYSCEMCRLSRKSKNFAHTM